MLTGLPANVSAHRQSLYEAPVQLHLYDSPATFRRAIGHASASAYKKHEYFPTLSHMRSETFTPLAWSPSCSLIRDFSKAPGMFTEPNEMIHQPWQPTLYRLVNGRIKMIISVGARVVQRPASTSMLIAVRLPLWSVRLKQVCRTKTSLSSEHLSVEIFCIVAQSSICLSWVDSSFLSASANKAINSCSLRTTRSS
jgi:hypothetical protein